MKRLLFIYLDDSSFVRDDRQVLAETYDVETFHFGTGLSRPALLRRVWEQRAWLKERLPGAAAIFGWFADYHLALPVQMAQQRGVPVAVCLGGFDANVVPSLNHGVYLSAWRAPLARYVIRHASHLLPVAQALVKSENRYAEWPRVLHNGVRAHVPGSLPPITVVPTGYDADAWPMGSYERTPSVLSVALVERMRMWRRKGLDVLVEAARLLPEVPFSIVGVSPEVAETLRPEVPENVRLLPPVQRADLLAHYQQADVYAQLSRSEGLPNVLCEAMLCGCVPVGSAADGIPEAVGDCGPIVPTPDASEAAAAIRQSLGGKAEARERARARIALRFPRTARREALLSVLSGLAQP